MFLARTVATGMILFFPLASNANPPPEELNAAVYNATVQVMHYCYEVKHKKDVELARCMAKEFIKEAPNPYDYRIFLNGDVPGNFILTISNASGYVLKCEVTAQQEIVVNNCSENQGPPIKPVKNLSITPTPNP